MSEPFAKQIQELEKLNDEMLKAMKFAVGWIDENMPDDEYKYYLETLDKAKASKESRTMKGNVELP